MVDNVARFFVGWISGGVSMWLLCAVLARHQYTMADAFLAWWLGSGLVALVFLLGASRLKAGNLQNSKQE